MTKDESSPDVCQYLWGMYQENCTMGRHHEGQRATVTNLVLVMAGFVITVATFDGGLTHADAFLGAFLVALGVFGAGFSVKQYERFRKHMKRAQYYREALDELLPSAAGTIPDIINGIDEEHRPKARTVIKAIKQIGDVEHDEGFWKRHSALNVSPVNLWRLHTFWLLLYLFVAGLGVALTAAALVSSN